MLFSFSGDQITNGLNCAAVWFNRVSVPLKENQCHKVYNKLLTFVEVDWKNKELASHIQSQLKRCINTIW